MLFVAVGLIGNNAFYLAAISRIGPAEANVVHYLWPVFLVAIASFVNRRSPSVIQIVGISAGFFGVAVALAPQIGHSLDIGGVALGICGALTFANYSVGRSLARVESNVLGPSLALAALIAFVFQFVWEQPYWPTAGQWIAIAMMGIGPFTLANFFWDRATRASSAATISNLAFLTPLVAISLLTIFGLGAVTMATLIGAGLAISGALLSSRA
ncbi:MAG: drug/metabolite transporter (DMT)-like permease [Patiriisocius sp.]|jgi:drug/metabolite transporter (DMT)-like permease